MNITKFKISLLAFAFVLLATVQGYSGSVNTIPETDTDDFQIVGFFDLRERESFIQITNTDSDPGGKIIHIQIFNVNDLCNENNFFDAYTPNDTHVYNLGDILTNDGNPSGVVLPSDAYGIVVATITSGPDQGLIGNLRIEDSSGYEYRTNLQGVDSRRGQRGTGGLFTFNFNTVSGVTLSDVVGFVLDNLNSDEVRAADVSEIWASFDIDILNDSEVIFSCRDVAFACINEDHPRLEELLEEAEVSVASFDYGINNAIPHSRGGELLCPGNTISDGIVRLDNITSGNAKSSIFFGFIGLNNGNGRGSMDSIWNQSSVFPFPSGDGGGG